MIEKGDESSSWDGFQWTPEKGKQLSLLKKRDIKTRLQR